MSTLITLLIVGCLLLAAGSLVALVLAIKRAPDGHEDASGFQVDAPILAAHPALPVEGSNNPWDYAQGANCPLNLGQSLGSIGSNQVSIHQP